MGRTSAEIAGYDWVMDTCGHDIERLEELDKGGGQSEAQELADAMDHPEWADLVYEGICQARDELWVRCNMPGPGGRSSCSRPKGHKGNHRNKYSKLGVW